MSPVQAVLLPINDDLIPYAQKVGYKLESTGLRTEVDGRTESLNKKIREAQLANIPLILTIGAKEKQADTLAVRTLDGKVKMGVYHDTFLQTVLEYIEKRRLNALTF
jgi:threonyl-tRNA synthetase